MKSKKKSCTCLEVKHPSKRIVITGGPGAGKTALLEIIKKYFCQHVAIVPEAASILFSGGFLRHKNESAIKAAQRAIYYVQRELEQLIEDEAQSALTICDRGTIDASAYWPGSEENFWFEVKSSKELELLRYDAVIHLRTPSLAHGYNHSNPVRIETAEEAALIDERIAKVWENHPRRYVIESESDFMEKVKKAIEIIETELPACCRS